MGSGLKSGERVGDCVERGFEKKKAGGKELNQEKKADRGATFEKSGERDGDR